MKIAVIYGGSSTERLPSEKNARAVCGSLLRRGYEALLLHYDEKMLPSLLSDRPDIVFLCVQGKYHGDGTLQAILDFLRIPYTGSSAAAASLINDKTLCKVLFAHNGQPTPPWYSLSRGEWESRSADFGAVGYPFVAKAPSQGGSFGISLIRSPEELGKLEEIFQYDDPILCEGFVDGRAYTVGLLETDGNVQALPCVEMLDKRIDREDGMILMTGDYSACAAELPTAVTEKMQTLAVEIFRACHARDYARVDFMVDNRTGEVQVLEINAVPGLKPASLYPMEAALVPMAYDDLIEHILLNAARREKLC